MTDLLTVFVLALFIIGLFSLYTLQKKHVKFSKRVFDALVAGVLFGGILQLVFGLGHEVIVEALEWIKVVGSGYVALLQMLIMPLVFISIVSAFTKLKDNGKLGKISFHVLAVLLSTTALAAVIGYGTVILFGLDGASFTQGAAETARIADITQRQAEMGDTSIPQQIISFIPRNIFADLSGTRATSTIAVVVFAAFVGVAYLGVKKQAEKEAKLFAEIIESFYKIIMRIVTLVLRLTPYGVFALMINVLATSDFQAILNLGKFIIASYVALLVVLVVHAIYLLTVRVNPIVYFKKAFPALSFAFTSRSSAGTLPLNVETQTQALGVNETIANFAASFGLSIGQNGCAGVYPAMLATMIAPTVGINIFDWHFVLLLVVIVTISSFGVAGVGGGATFASLIVLGSLNLPVAIVGLVISVEPLIDMARTLVNVSDAMVAGVVTSAKLDELDRSQLEDEQAVIQGHSS